MTEPVYSQSFIESERARYYAYGRIDSRTDGKFLGSAEFVVAVAAQRVATRVRLEDLYDRLFDEKYGFAPKPVTS